MQAFVTEYYVEPENILTEIVQDEDIYSWFALLTMSVSHSIFHTVYFTQY
jgi:hypothetical protein